MNIARRSWMLWIPAMVVLTVCGGSGEPRAGSEAAPGDGASTADAEPTPRTPAGSEAASGDGASTADAEPTPQTHTKEVAKGEVTFASTGRMTTARQSHTATVLADGRVLVAGGRTPVGGRRAVRQKVYESAEVYDPALGSWSETGSMTHERAAHTTTRLEDGRVLAVGTKGKKTTPELFDPSTSLWSLTGEMVKPRGEHTATLLRDGKVLVTGGRTAILQYLETAEIYDAATDAWTETAPMAAERAFHTATLLESGKVLVVGSDVTLQFLATAELYDPETGSWSPTGSLAEGRAKHTATLLKDGRVLVVGSTEKRSAEVYDPSTESWSSAGSTAETRGEHAAAILPDGRVLIMGGSFEPFLGQAQARPSAEIYDPMSNTWSAAGSMTDGRYRFTASVLQDGRVLVVGGQHEQTAYDTAEVFSP